MKLHERIKQLRKETGLNQKDFAASMDMEQSKYNKWENGKNAPDYDGICSLADRFEVSTDYLLGRTDVKSPDIDIQAICNKTGLSEGAIHKLVKLQSDSLFMERIHGESERGRLDAVGALLESQTHILLSLCEYLFSDIPRFKSAILGNHIDDAFEEINPGGQMFVFTPSDVLAVWLVQVQQALAKVREECFATKKDGDTNAPQDNT